MSLCTKDYKIYIDVSSIIKRFAKGQRPTGIDRTLLAYIQHYKHQAFALVRWGRHYWTLPRHQSAQLLQLLCSNTPQKKMKALIFRGILTQLFRKEPPAPLPQVGEGSKPLSPSFLLNIDYSGLGKSRYLRMVKKLNLKPLFFVHDLIPITHPKYFPKFVDRKHKERINQMLKIAEGIIVNSQATQKELIQYAEQSNQTLPPILKAWLSSSFQQPVTKQRLVNEPYFVMLGTIEPRKNHLLILKIWHEFAIQYGDRAPKLVVIGQNGWNNEHVLHFMEQEPHIQNLVFYKSNCADDELVQYLYHAQALLFPSFTEGYGLPLIEALTMNIPTIVSDIPIFREIAQDVPEYIDPVDSQHWAETIMTYTEENSLSRTAQLQRLSHFQKPNWETHFEEVDAFIEKRCNCLSSSPCHLTPDYSYAPRNVGNGERQDDKIIGSVQKQKKIKPLEINEFFLIEGWAISTQGIACINVYINNVLIGKAHYGTLRYDIYAAYPHMPNAGRSGFCFAANQHFDLSLGKHQIKIEAQSKGGKTKIWTRTLSIIKPEKYQKWLSQNEKIYAHQTPTLPTHLLSILFIVKTTNDLPCLSQSLAALAMQKANFELLFIADEKIHPMIIHTVNQYQLSKQSRIMTFPAHDWSTVIAACHGTLVGFMDVGDVLKPWALNLIENAVQTNKEIDLLYGDEDFIRGDQTNIPMFKPGWSPIFLSHFNYIGKPWFASQQKMISALTGVDLQLKEINEHLLLKRIGQLSLSVCHIPTVLVSRQEGILKNIADKDDFSCTMTPKVSIIIPTRLENIHCLERCFSGLMHSTAYPNLEIIILVNNLKEESLIEAFLKKWPFTILFVDGPFNWAKLNNFGAQQATGDYFLFLNDDIEPLHLNWLKRMVQTIITTNAGAVGALLKYPNGAIQHAGIRFASKQFRHLFRFCSGDEAHLQWLLHSAREVSAVTGACLLTSRICFEENGGFDEALPIVYNDIDFCLRISQNGYPVVIEPRAYLTHQEGMSRQGLSEKADAEYFWKKWEPHLKTNDRFTNPNLDNLQDNWTVDENNVVAHPYQIDTDFNKELFI